MSSDAELDAKLEGLLRVIMSRLPANKKLPTAVVQQLLLTKYGDIYSEAYVKSHETYIADTILKLAMEEEKAAMSAAAEKHALSSSSANSDDDDDDESEDDSEADVGSGEDDEEEASVATDDEEDEEEEDELYSDDDDDDSENDEEGEPDLKKARQEELDAIAKKGEQQQQKTANGEVTSNNCTTATLAERCKAMAECLRKLSYRVRAPSDAETLEAYLQNFLIAEFKKHDMDPEKYSKSDIKRYRIKREVELLQQDGASLSLDRRNRAGRGFSNVVVSPDGAASAASGTAAASKQTSMFLDDE